MTWGRGSRLDAREQRFHDVVCVCTRAVRASEDPERVGSDLVVNVPQASNLAQVRKLLLDVIAADQRFQTSPAPTIYIGEITDASSSRSSRAPAASPSRAGGSG